MELSDNPWKYPHAAVMKKNSTFIRDHLNLEFLNGTIDREMALMFVGKSEVGKTSLLKALLSEDKTADHVGLEDRTCGIELHSWKPLHSKTSPLFNIYDFAGLEMYECMHLNLCLLRRAIYCLVWRPFARLEPDACLDKNGVPAQEPWYRVPALGKCTRKQLVPYLQDQVTPWIDKLYRRVPGFTYLLIATHLDIVDQEDVAWQTQTIRQCVSTHMKHLGQRFSHVAAPTMLSCSTNLCVSATTGQNITLLQETLVNETVKLPFFGEILPKSWTKARQSIAQIRSIHRATLRTRKKEAHQEKVHTLFTQIRDPAGADSGLSPNSTNLNSEPPSDDEVSNVSSSDIMPLWKLWQIFAMRSLLRMRLKRAISTTPEMAKGSMWIGHFKTLLKKAGIEEDQMFQVMRYFHDAGWIRCYGFNDTKLSKVRSNEHDGGFEMLDPYRCSCFKVATNSYVAMYRRDSGDRPPDVRPEAWTDMCDTVFLDLQWLFRMTLSVVTHDGTPIIAGQTSMQLRTEAQRLYSFGELQWAPGSPNLIGSLWKYFLPDHEFRRIRNVLESKSILTPSSENRSLLYVPELRKLVPLEDAQTRSSSHHQDWAPDNLQAPKPKHIPDEAAPQLTTNHAHHTPTHYEHATPDTMEDTTTDTTFLTTTSVHRGTSSEAPAHELPSLPQPTTLLSVRKNTQHAPLLNRKHLLGRTADNMQPGRCSVFLSYEQVEAGGKEHVYSSYIWPILKHNVETIAHASVLKSSDYKTDLEMEAAIEQCSILIMCVSDEHIRSKMGQAQLFAALNHGLHVIAVVMPNYTVWPPSLKDGCWWDIGEKDAVAKYLYMASIIDLARGHYHVYYDILARMQEAEADGDVEPQDVKVVWNSIKDGEFDEDDPDLHDQVRMESQVLQLSKESLVLYRTWSLDSFVQTIESVGTRVSQLFYRKPSFFPDLSAEELKSKHEIAKKVIKRWELAGAKMEAAKMDQERMQEQLAIAKKKDEEARESERVQELQGIRQKAHLWHSDPLHAKLELLKDIANVVPGLGSQPRWNFKLDIFARAQDMAQQVMEEQQEEARQKEEDERLDEEAALSPLSRVGSRQYYADGALEELEQLDADMLQLAVAAASLAGVEPPADADIMTRFTSLRSADLQQGMTPGISSVSLAAASDTSRPADMEETKMENSLQEGQDPFFNLVGPAYAEKQGQGRKAHVLMYDQNSDTFKAHIDHFGRVAKEPFLLEALADSELVGKSLARGLTLGALQIKAGN